MNSELKTETKLSGLLLAIRPVTEFCCLHFYLRALRSKTLGEKYPNFYGGVYPTSLGLASLATAMLPTQSVRN